MSPRFAYIERISISIPGDALQVLELIILAALAAVVLFQLYAVLGRRVGRGPEDTPRVQTAPATLDAPRPSAAVNEEAQPLAGVAAVRARDPAFDVGRFLQGAQQAYELIVQAFAKGDREVLKPLLSAPVMESFETAMAEREAEGRTEAVEFLHPPRADFEGVDLIGDLAKASVRFLCEIRRRSKGSDGETVDDRRTAEVWTFERNLKGRGPNWTLIHVDAAEA